VGGALFQAIMGLVLDAYGKVGDKFPVGAYRWSFVFCIATLVAGTIAIYFTIDTQALLKKKEG